MKRILLSAVVLSAVGLNAQSKAPAVKTEKAVGIETSQPRATLDVNGDARLQKVEKMVSSTPTEEIFPDCPCVLTIDKYGVIKRIPKDQFVLASGSTSGSSGSGTTTGGGTSGNPGGGQGGNPNQGGNNQSTGGANLGTGVRANINDQEDFVVSFIYDGHQLQGKIDNSSNKVVVNIPYTNGNGAQYNEATSTTMTSAASAQDGQSSPITMTIKQGALSSGNGNITAEITTPALYNVKKLAPGKVETIAEFKYTVNDITRKVVLKAVGGVPDKQFSEQINGEYKHRFIYVPVTVKGTHNVKGKPYSKVWLNQNLGADYANLDGGHFSPKKVGGDDHNDYKAYGSAFQWGRVDNTGYELVDWSKSDSEKRLYPRAPWYSDGQLKTFTDPCPKGYHTPSMTDWEDLHEALTGSRASVSNNKIYTDTKLKLSAAGYRNYSSGSSFSYQSNYGFYWSSTAFGSSDGRNLYFYSSRSNPQDYNYRSGGFSVRCLKDGQ